MKRIILAIACLALLSTAVQAADEGKHLFILSGQSNMAGMDPNISFIPAVEKEFGKENVIVVKDAHGGREIKDWCKHQGSLDGKGHKNSRSGLYNKLLKKLKPAIEGQKLQTVTFVWMQGERDAKMSRADVYEKAFKKLIQQVEADVGKKDINFVIGRISDHGNEKIPEWNKIRDIHVKLAEDSPRGEWVDTDDLNNKTRGPKSWDDLHLTKDGYKILGERFAEKAIELVKK
jgi:hypothetical protein